MELLRAAETVRGKIYKDHAGIIDTSRSDTTRINQSSKMSTASENSVKDLEKGVEISDETSDETSEETSEEECDEEQIQLLEDVPTGKLIYFLSPYFFEKTWIMNIVFAFSGANFALFPQLVYLGLYEFYYPQVETKLSDIFSPLCISWLIINYIFLFVMFLMGYIINRKNVDIGTKALQDLLEEVAEADLIGDPEAWRGIASRVNQRFMEEKYNSSIFYSGEQCRWFFVRDIVKPIESGTWDIRTFYEEGKPTKYFQYPSNKKLAERAVANYNKSFEGIEEFSVTDEKDDWIDVFGKFCNIIWIAFFYFLMIEFVIFIFVALVFVSLAICYGIFLLMYYIYSKFF